MQFEKLIYGKLIKRYKRFLADIILENGDEDLIKQLNLIFENNANFVEMKI